MRLQKAEEQARQQRPVPQPLRQRLRRERNGHSLSQRVLTRQRHRARALAQPQREQRRAAVESPEKVRAAGVSRPAAGNAVQLPQKRCAQLLPEQHLEGERVFRPKIPFQQAGGERLHRHPEVLRRTVSKIALGEHGVDDRGLFPQHAAALHTVREQDLAAEALQRVGCAKRAGTAPRLLPQAVQRIVYHVRRDALHGGHTGVAQLERIKRQPQAAFRRGAVVDQHTPRVDIVVQSRVGTGQKRNDRPGLALRPQPPVAEDRVLHGHVLERGMMVVGGGQAAAAPENVRAFPGGLHAEKGREVVPHLIQQLL